MRRHKTIRQCHCVQRRLRLVHRLLRFRLRPVFLILRHSACNPCPFFFLLRLRLSISAHSVHSPRRLCSLSYPPFHFAYFAYFAVKKSLFFCMPYVLLRWPSCFFALCSFAAITSEPAALQRHSSNRSNPAKIFPNRKRMTGAPEIPNLCYLCLLLFKSFALFPCRSFPCFLFPLCGDSLCVLSWQSLQSLRLCLCVKFVLHRHGFGVSRAESLLRHHTNLPPVVAS